MSSPGHALLGASSSARWMQCPASVEANANTPRTTSPAAEEGTRAHAVAELLFDGISRPEIMDHVSLEDAAGGMVSFAEEYVSHVQELVPPEDRVLFEIEAQVDYTQWVPGGFGTADAVIVSRDGTLYVRDLKYGRHPVAAEWNSQLMLYALGAIQTFGWMVNIERVNVGICQPRIGNYDAWEVSVEDILFSWAEGRLAEAVRDVEADSPEYRPSTAACQWCAIKDGCKARAEEQLRVASEEFSVEWGSPGDQQLTPARVGELVPLVAELAQWCKDFSGYHRGMLERGERGTGYELVQGRQGNRIFTDPEEVASILKGAKVKLSDSHTEPRLKSPTQLESVLKGLRKAKALAALEEFVTRKPPSKKVVKQGSGGTPAGGSSPDDDFS